MKYDQLFEELLCITENLPRLFWEPKNRLNVCSDSLCHRKCLDASIQAYFNELEKSLEFIRETPELSVDEKKRFFKSANTNLGEYRTHSHYPDL